MRFLVFALVAIAVVYGQGTEKICEPGSHFKDACNQCICSKDGTAKSCTFMLCPETLQSASHDEIPEDVSEPQTKAPKPIPESTLVRRRRQVSHDRPCVPGEAIKVYCNVCRCGSDGHGVVCPRKGCPEGFYNEDGSLTELGKATIKPAAE